MGCLGSKEQEPLLGEARTSSPQETSTPKPTAIDKTPPMIASSGKNTPPVDTDDIDRSKPSKRITTRALAGCESLKKRSDWDRDEEAHVCTSCGWEFSTFTRRHHCRLCGKIFCDRCSSFKVEDSKLESRPRHRCCKHCFESFLRI
mmetsp:Transcript_4431/g.9669  ORF Transcript_4431/g.9669 Transcript_4431/m.9669 type:complete len:146 (+) Transcript_4431:3-440(+)